MDLSNGIASINIYPLVQEIGFSSATVNGSELRLSTASSEKLKRNSFIE